MKLIELPPAPNEKQLTAKSAPENLSDHKKFFLNFNNKNSWPSEEQYELNKKLLSDRIHEISTSTGRFLTGLKATARSLKTTFKRAGNTIKTHQIYTLLAGALGYSSYELALKCRTADNFIENIWPSDVVLGKDFLEVRLGEEDWPSTKLIDDLRPRIAFNTKRDRVAKANAKDLRNKRRPRTTQPD